eukprot:scaffold4019_cov143-Amphora_coffeaeformis.AAC.3
MPGTTPTNPSRRQTMTLTATRARKNQRMPRRINHARQYQAFFLQLLTLFALITVLSAEQQSHSARGLADFSSSVVAPSMAPTQHRGQRDDDDNDDDDDDSSPVVVVSDVLQITETEMWDGGKWKSGGDSRWTQRTDNDPSNIGSAANVKDGQPCASPDKQEPPEGYRFDGEWKIVTGGSSRDSYGWEYTVAHPFPVRQRVWLRNLVQEEPKPKKEILKIRKKTDAVKKRKRLKMPRWMRAISDDFNFKGFGLSLYKSLVFPESFGMAFRIPLTYNFNRWETMRGLPSVSSSIGLYFPGTAMISISTSVRLEALKWVSARVSETTFYLLLALIWTFVRGMVLAASAVAYPITRQLYQPPIPMKSPWAMPSTPSYSRIVEERVGCSFSWRVSRSRGYHFRVSYWHYYAPTLASFWPVMEGLASFLQRQEKATMPEWWARRKAAIGLSTSGPIPDPPFVTSSLAMSLSGYYFRPGQRVRLVASASPSTPKKTTSSVKKQEREEDSTSKSRSLGQHKTWPKVSVATTGDASDHKYDNKIFPEKTRKVKKV